MEEKDELCKDIIGWVNNAIEKLNKFKKSALEIVTKGKPIEELDENTLDVLRIIIGLRESRLKRKRYVQELMKGIKKGCKEIEQKAKKRVEETKQRSEEVKKLMEGYRKEREEAQEVWKEIRITMDEGRKTIDDG